MNGFKSRKFIAMLVGLIALFLAAFFRFDGIYIYLISLVAAYITGNAIQNFALTNKSEGKK